LLNFACLPVVPRAQRLPEQMEDSTSGTTGWN